MLKKNYFYLSLAVIATVYNAIQLIFYPELTPMWFIRVMGGFFVFLAIGYIFDILNLRLRIRIKKLDELIAEKNLKTEN